MKAYPKHWNPYIQMAHHGDDYLDIKNKAKADGLEGDDLKYLLYKIDDIITENQIQKNKGQEEQIFSILKIIAWIMFAVLASYGGYRFSGVLNYF